jgi:hypothetical protein
MDRMGNWNASHPKALKQKKSASLQLGGGVFLRLFPPWIQMPALVRIEQTFDIVMTFAERCEEMEGNFELRAFIPIMIRSHTPATASDTFFGRRVSID